MTHFLYVWLGLSNGSGSSYLFWSGSFPTILQLFEYTVVVFLVYWHHICHEDHCYRWGRHIDSDGIRRCHKCRKS